MNIFDCKFRGRCRMRAQPAQFYKIQTENNRIVRDEVPKITVHGQLRHGRDD
jgi:hypothetical protein